MISKHSVSQDRAFHPIALPSISRGDVMPAIAPALVANAPAPPLPIEAIFLRRTEAARSLGISTSLLAKLTARGEIRSVKIGKRAVRYRPGDLQAWADRQAAQ